MQTGEQTESIPRNFGGADQFPKDGNPENSDVPSAYTRLVMGLYTDGNNQEKQTLIYPYRVYDYEKLVTWLATPWLQVS